MAFNSLPFVGRQHEMERLRRLLESVPLVALHDAVGSGRSRFVAEPVSEPDTPSAAVEYQSGDRAEAVRKRAERTLCCVPGELIQESTQRAYALVLDDVDNLEANCPPSMLASFPRGPLALRERRAIRANEGLGEPRSRSTALDLVPQKARGIRGDTAQLHLRRELARAQYVRKLKRQLADDQTEVSRP